MFFPLHLQKPYLCDKYKNFEISEKLYELGLCLPTYPDLKKKEIIYITEKIKKFFD